MRSAGVLLNVSSLPGPYGVGVFGKEAKIFIDSLSEMKFKAWQVLPFTMIDSGNSPYASVSAFAGNYLYIDPRGLVNMGLVTEEEAKTNEYPDSPYTADYKFAAENRMNLLKLAFTRVDSELTEKIKKFCSQTSWLEDFSLYMSLKQENNDAPWWEWENQYADYSQCVLQKEKFKADMLFWQFVQYLFFTQWNEIRTYADQHDIKIIGDMPIYVSMDSCDVWSAKEHFQLDKETFKPKKVAGVPPDYFSEDGQLWGNPLYDWAQMEKEGYKWWIERIKNALSVYHTVRIDHFRGFASYWAIDAKETSAKNGEWEKGPGFKLFDAVNKAFDTPPSIIAEDLGVFGEDVVQLLEQTKFPGMRVVQFGFDPSGDSSHLPHNYPINCIAYPGTHDNNTLLGWLWEAKPEERDFALRYCGYEDKNWGDGGPQSKSLRSIIETVWRSSAQTAVIAIQDMLGYGSDARMNIPGVPENNWRFRITEGNIQQLDKKYFKEINQLYRR